MPGMTPLRARAAASTMRTSTTTPEKKTRYGGVRVVGCAGVVTGGGASSRS